MHYLKSCFSLLLLFVCLALAGCGGSSSGSGTAVSDPMAAGTTGSGTGTGTTPITAQDPKVNLSVLPDRQEIDANIGTVLLTAKLFSSTDLTYIDPVTGEVLFAKAGDPLPNKSVTFKILAGPGTISYTTPVTDKNGVSTAIMTTGDVNYTTNVLVEASTTVDDNVYRAYTSLQVVRGAGIINFMTSKGPTDPDGTLNTLEKSVDVAFAGMQFEYMQSVPFKVTDSNGNPRVGIPVTLSIDNQLTGTATVRINNPTVTTDSTGSGIFNIGVKMTAPPPNVTNTDSIIYKAVTSGTNPLVAYGGFISALTTGPPKQLTIDPLLAYFSETDTVGAKKYFTISGGVTPYTVIATSPAWVSVALLADGHTVEATLVNASLWSGAASFTVRDAYGNTTIFTPNIYRADYGQPHISPLSASFASTDVAGATINFTISGGTKPYIVTASNPSRVSVALQPDGITAIATLVDASLWTGSVTFTATDVNGNSVIFTPVIYRQ